MDDLKDHQIAEVVNTLRDIAIKFHSAQQLRERIAHVIVPLLSRRAVPQANAEQNVKPGNSSFDSNYIGRKLGIIARDMRSYTAQEMARELVRLAKVSDESEAIKEAIRAASKTTPSSGGE